jgi:hypothetical protein
MPNSPNQQYPPGKAPNPMDITDPNAPNYDVNYKQFSVLPPTTPLFDLQGGSNTGQYNPQNSEPYSIPSEDDLSLNPYTEEPSTAGEYTIKTDKYY